MTTGAGERDVVYLPLDMLPQHSRYAVPALKAYRKHALWRVAGAHIRRCDAGIVDMGPMHIGPNRTIASLSACSSWRSGSSDPNPHAPDYDLEGWLRRLGFSDRCDFSEIARMVPVEFLAPLGHQVATSQGSGPPIAGFRLKCLLWSLHMGWHSLRASHRSWASRIRALAEALDVSQRSARRLGVCSLSASLGVPPLREEAQLLAIALHFSPLDRRLGYGASLKTSAARLHLEWESFDREPLMLWIRALMVKRSFRWTALSDELPFFIEEDRLLLREWLAHLVNLAKARNPDPIHSRALVAGWISDLDPDQIRELLFAATVRPILETGQFRADSPLARSIRVGGMTARPICTEQELLSHPSTGNFYCPDTHVRQLFEGVAWYFGLRKDDGQEVLAVFYPDSEFSSEDVGLFAASEFVADHAPWLPLLSVLKEAIDLEPHRQGDAAYRARLKEGSPHQLPLPGDAPLEEQLAWAEQRSQALRAREFMEGVARIPGSHWD